MAGDRGFQLRRRFPMKAGSQEELSLSGRQKALLKAGLQEALSLWRGIGGFRSGGAFPKIIGLGLQLFADALKAFDFPRKIF